MDLPQQFLLMATRDRTGRAMGYHTYGFGAAVLAEMVLRGHLRLDRKRLHVEGDAPTDPRYATVWHDVHVRRTTKAATWVSRLSGGRYKLLRRQFTQDLVDAGVLREEPTWGGGVRFPSNGMGAEDRLRGDIRKAVDARDASDERIVCLVAILVAGGSGAEMDPDRRVRRAIRRQAKQWIKEEPFARSVQELIAAITAAMVAATMAASAAS